MKKYKLRKIALPPNSRKKYAFWQKTGCTRQKPRIYSADPKKYDFQRKKYVSQCRSRVPRKKYVFPEKKIWVPAIKGGTIPKNAFPEKKCANSGFSDSRKKYAESHCTFHLLAL